MITNYYKSTSALLRISYKLYQQVPIKIYFVLLTQMFVFALNIGINSEFLMKFSNEDISINFDLRNIQASEYQTQKAWFKSGILVDLSCNQAFDVLQQVEYFIVAIFFFFNYEIHNMKKK